MAPSSGSIAPIPASLALVALAGSASLLWLLTRKKNDTPSIRKEDATSNTCIYLDYNGTTPIDPEVTAAMMPFLTQHFGNPGSGHCFGDLPRQAVAKARQQILTHLLGVPDDEPLASCIFTSCGTEADNMAIHLALASSSKSMPHVVTTNVEHPAVEKCLQYYERLGKCTVTYVPVQPDGCVSSKDILDSIQSNTVLVALMLANNESGALQPVRQLAEYCRDKSILCFTDAAQAAGKISIRLADMGYPDMVTIVGHKLGAPKGIACLYVRAGCVDNVPPLLHGGGQEYGMRGGTENVPYIVGFGVAAELAAKKLQSHSMETLRDRLITRLTEALGDSMVIHGPVDKTQRLPNTLSVGFRGVQSATLLRSIRDQVAASAGATCHANGPISAVLKAMQIPDDVARGTVRLSLGPNTTPKEIDKAAKILIEQIEAQRMGKSQ